MGRGEGRRTGERERVDVLAVVATGHVLLAKTNSVLALRDAVKDLEGFFGDALYIHVRSETNVPRQCKKNKSTHAAGEVHLNSENTDVLRSLRRLVDIRRGGRRSSRGHCSAIGVTILRGPVAHRSSHSSNSKGRF